MKRVRSARVTWQDHLADDDDDKLRRRTLPRRVGGQTSPRGGRGLQHSSSTLPRAGAQAGTGLARQSAVDILDTDDCFIGDDLRSTNTRGPRSQRRSRYAGCTLSNIVIIGSVQQAGRCVA